MWRVLVLVLVLALALALAYFVLFGMYFYDCVYCVCVRARAHYLCALEGTQEDT